MNEDDSDDLAQRRMNEIEFILAAYTSEEVWIGGSVSCDSRDKACKIIRRLVSGNATDLFSDESCLDAAQDRVVFLIQVSLPPLYPSKAALVIDSIDVDETNSTTSKRNLMKAAYNALPGLTNCCRQTAESHMGMESIFAVFSAAEEWVRVSLPGDDAAQSSDTPVLSLSASRSASRAHKGILVLGRRLIYSHHIISKHKRADLKTLFHDFHLNGYVKIGWPGIILIEGLEEDCQSFYDTIKRWAWQYLVVRGEMQEETHDLNGSRLLPQYSEVEDLSVIAVHCRQVGLEALFRTMMKVYESPASAGSSESPTACTDERTSGTLYGVLIHVDHMNDGRAYRKWLRKTSHQLDVCLMVKECRPNEHVQDSGVRRPTIVVALVGGVASVRSMLKRWRTTRVDVDSSGKPCLERMMTILIERELEPRKSLDRLDWELLESEDATNRQLEKPALSELAESIGGQEWVCALEDVLHLRDSSSGKP